MPLHGRFPLNAYRRHYRESGLVHYLIYDLYLSCTSVTR
jgi:hypothetical protein